MNSSCNKTHPSLFQIINNISENCIRCDRCWNECEFLKRYGKPKDIAESYNPADKRLKAMPFECSLCGLCDAVCPVNIRPSLMFLEMRRNVSGKEDFFDKRYKGLVTYEKIGASKLFSYYGLPDNGHSILFPGCAFAGTRSEKTLELYKLLKKHIPDIGIVLDCCTKISHDLGRDSFFHTGFNKMKDILVNNGILNIYVMCPNCYMIFKKYGKEFTVITVYELLAQKGIPEGKNIQGDVTIHDPCVIRDEKNIHSAVRNLIERTGLSIKEMEHSAGRTVCCGEGGAVGYVSPDLAKKWGHIRKRESNGLKIITYCAGCAQTLSKFGETIHISDLIFEPEAVLKGKAVGSKSPFTYLERIKLKNKLKKETGT